MTAKNEQQLIIPTGEQTSQIRNRMDPTNRGLRLINPQAKDFDDHKEAISRTPRLRYAAMRAHMEMSAQVIAVGGTQKMAAKYAGVSPRQIKKYYQDADFRTRVEELRGLLASRIKGKILRELNRRTTGQNLQNMDLLDMLRVFDRVTVGGKGMAITVEGDVNVQQNRYDAILTALFNPNAGEEGSNFPGYEPEDVSISGDDS